MLGACERPMRAPAQTCTKCQTLTQAPVPAHVIDSHGILVATRIAMQIALLSLPCPEEHGGGEQPYEVYLQVLEEIGAVWSSVGVGVSVHALSCFGLLLFRTAGLCATAPMLGARLVPGKSAVNGVASSEPSVNWQLSSTPSMAVGSGHGV